MKRSPGFLALSGLLLLLGGLAYLSIELVQRRRYAVVEEDITQAVRDFTVRAKPVWDAPAGRLRQAGPSEPALGTFEYIIALHGIGGNERMKSWLIDTDIPDANHQYNKINFYVRLEQERGIFLRGPRVTLHFPASQDPAFQRLLEQALQEREVSFSFRDLE